MVMALGLPCVSLLVFPDRKRGKERLYLQQQLTDNVGPAIYADFVKFGWDKLEVLQVSKQSGWP